MFEPPPECPRCKQTSGDDWSQCPRDGCPIEGSPHFSTQAAARHKKKLGAFYTALRSKGAE